MKEIMGGAWFAGLVACMFGLYLYAIAMAVVGVLAGAASWYDELLQEKQATSWRRKYPRYRY